MKKNYLLLLSAAFFIGGNSFAQSGPLPCATDQMRQRLIAQHPEILQTESQLEQEIQNKLRHIDFSKVSRTTDANEMDSADFVYNVPIVIHFINDCGAENLPDDTVFSALKDWNLVYSKQNWDTSQVIPTYAGNIPGTNVPYIGNVHIRLHLATIDPSGNPTKGIVRHRSYLTYTGGEPAKLDDWPPTSYVNIWVVNTMSQGNQEAAAYAFEPPEAAADPEGDGIIALYNYFQNAYSGSLAVSKTINHEMGHIFNLYHPWGNDNNPQVALGSDDVDDTPPTWGHNPVGCEYSLPSSDDNSIYDSLYATNYYVVYPRTDSLGIVLYGADSLVNYPDTTNTQNIMDYTYCARMFTYGQAQRMHAAANSDVAGRDNLWSTSNLANTGALAPAPDYKPNPDFFASASGINLTANTPTNYKNRPCYFTFPNSPVVFTNESWNDTITHMLWSFEVGGATQTSTALTSTTQTFSNSGWVSLSLTATGNNTGDSTLTWPRAVFVASDTATSGNDYIQEFSGSDTAQWPMFNYYGNQFKWQMANVGMWDRNSVEYMGFDTTVNISLFGVPPTPTNTPGGDFDDLFSVPFDLSGYGVNPAYLNFYFSSAQRSIDPVDEMDIDYATKGSGGAMSAWTNLAKITSKLDNRGEDSSAYTPTSASDWAPMGFELPASAKTAYTVFRFRYMPGNDPATTLSGGNNYFLDRLTFSPWPAAVNNVAMTNNGVVLVPNPTNSDAYVVVKDADNTTAQIIVTDITGKEVYRTSQQVSGSEAKILIPHQAIAVQGMYIVQTITGNQTNTQKLVVE